MRARGNMDGQRSIFAAASLVVGSLISTAIAAGAAEPAVETILNDLRIPTGVAVRPTAGAESYEVYVADVGAGRVARIQSNKPNDSEDAITGFVSSSDVDDTIHLPGPYGLLFLDSTRLVVTGSEGDKRSFVRLYELTGQEKPLSAEQHEKQAAPAAADEDSDDDVASFHMLARTLANDQVPDSLVLAAVGNEIAASVWRLPVRGGTLGDLKLLGKDQPYASSLAIAVEPRGYIILVRPHETSGSASSRIAFVHPIDGRTAVEMPVNLPGIVGVAYSPRTGNLYAICHAPLDAKRSGVYRIDADETSAASEPSTTVTRIVDVERPTALAFGPDGALYVTSLGELESRDNTRGSLLKITGDL